MGQNFSQLDVSGKRVFVCSVGGVPHRSHGASVILFFSYLEQLKLNNFQILHWIILDSEKDYTAELEVYKNELATVGCFDVVVSKTPVIEHLSKWLKKITFAPLFSEIKEEVQRFNPDVILCFDLASAGFLEEYLKQSQAKKIIWLGDLRYQTNWYHWIYSIKESWWHIIRLPFVWLVSYNWQSLYRRLLPLFQLVVVSSKSSENQLEKFEIRARYFPYPWPVNIGVSVFASHKNKLPTFLFAGTLVALGSRSAFHFLLKKVYPHLIKIWGKGGFKILVCGSYDLPNWVKKALVGKLEVEYLGFVEDLEKLMETCHALIVPIDVPVGNRSRIVTAMALGTLVIAHQNTTLGNPDLVDNKTCYLANSGVDFAIKMQLAYNRPDLSLPIIERAKEVYRNRFAPKVAGDLLIQEIKRLVN